MPPMLPVAVPLVPVAVAGRGIVRAVAVPAVARVRGGALVGGPRVGLRRRVARRRAVAALAPVPVAAVTGAAVAVVRGVRGRRRGRIRGFAVVVLALRGVIVTA